MSAVRGSVYTWTATVRDALGDAVDTPDLTIDLADPLAAPVAGFPHAIPPIVHDGIGIYHYDWTVAGNALLGVYTATWEGTVDGSTVIVTDTASVITGTITTRFLDVADVRAVFDTPLTDEALEDVIRREEAWLTRRIGQLDGERTQVIYRDGFARDEPIFLPRPTDLAVIVDGGVELEDDATRFLDNGWAIERAGRAWVGPEVAITFTPNDADEVRRVLLELVQLTASETGFLTERIGEYSYSRGSSRTSNTAFLASSSRESYLRELRRPSRYATVRTPTAVTSGRVGP